MLEIKNITYKYDDKLILDDLSYDFKANNFYAIVGESGAGKTTFLSIISGIEKSQNGTILLNGEDVTNWNVTKYLKKNGIIFQHYNLINYLTPIENIVIALDILKKRNQKEVAKELLTKVGITGDLQNMKCAKLSGGQQQRVAIARALAQDSDVIFADEPTGNLDPRSSFSIVKLLKKLSDEEKKCIICVTHSDSVKNSADVVLKLEKGHLELDKINI